jgi:hypothetical protein
MRSHPNKSRVPGRAPRHAGQPRSGNQMVNDGFMNLAAEYPSRAAWTWQTPTRVYVPDGEWRRGSCRQLWIGLIRLGGIGAMGWALSAVSVMSVMV